MKLKKIISLILTGSVMMTSSGVAQAGYSVTGEGVTSWDLTDITTEIGYDASVFQVSGGKYEYNSLTLHGGSTIANITDEGLIGTKNVGYIEFTPTTPGNLTVTADVTGGAKMYVDVKTSNENEDRLLFAPETTVENETSPSIPLRANTKYYIYNRASKAHKIKSLTFTETEEVEIDKSGQYIHVSFDDVYQCLQDLTTNADTYTSVFDSPFFAYIKGLHDEYGAVFSLYCFNTASGWDIETVTDKFQTELSENSDWIKFGFHSEDADTNYGTDDEDGKYGTALGDCAEKITASYNKFLAGVERLTGNCFESVDHIARLGFFAGTKTNVTTLKSLGMTGFIGSESTSRTSYYLDTDASKTMHSKGVYEDTAEGLLFLPSQTRLESVASAEKKTVGKTDEYLANIYNIETAKVIEIFTHEGRWKEKESDTTYGTPNTLNDYLSWAKENGYSFGYAQNVYTEYAPQNPDSTQSPDATSQPVATQTPDATQAPDATQTPVVELAEGYDLTSLTDNIEYNEADFQSGTPYTYINLTVTGGSSAAKIDTNGVKFTKQTSTQMYFTYTATEDGTLKVTADLGYSGSYYSKIYVDTDLGKRSNLVIDGTADDMASGETTVEAGKTYYIYNATSAPTVFKSIELYTDSATPKVPELSLYNIYGDNMMLQRNAKFTLNGRYKHVSGIEVSLKNNTTGNVEQIKQAVLGNNLTWNVELDAVSNYTDTYTISLTPTDEGGETVTLSNVIFGDVYFLGGQSNTVREIGFYKTLGIDYTDEYVNTSNIRMLDITGGKKISGDNTGELKSSTPSDEFLVGESITYEIAPQWTAFTEDLDYENVSALAYSFVTKLYEQTNIPVGIIATGYDGTEIAQWLPDSGTCFYNSRIYPFRSFNLSGILWYQGESDRNMDTPLETYKEKLTQLIHHYRELFANTDDVPFYYVSIPRTSGNATDPQNPEIGATANAKLALIRQAQTEVYTELSKTEDNFGIVPMLDIYGNKNYDAPNNGSENGNNRKGFHVGQKPLAAQRLVNWVLKDLHGQDVKAIGPVYRSGISQNGKIILTYECDGDLRLLDKEHFTDSMAESRFTEYGIDTSTVQEFEIAGEDGVYYRANAELNGNTVILYNDNVKTPVYFRYAHTGYGGDTYIECPNLTDESGMSALVTAGQVVLIEDGDYAAQMTLSENILTINASEAVNEAVLIKAVYDSGTVDSVSIVSGVNQLEQGENTVEIEREEKTVKYFLWNSLEEMKPLSEAVTAE